METAKLRNENHELKKRSNSESELIGNSAAINLVRQTVEKVAPTNSRVLITGAPGTGKELIAKSLHTRSMRGHANFVVLNAAALQARRTASSQSRSAFIDSSYRTAPHSCQSTRCPPAKHAHTHM